MGWTLSGLFRVYDFFWCCSWTGYNGVDVETSKSALRTSGPHFCLMQMMWFCWHLWAINFYLFCICNVMQVVNTVEPKSKELDFHIHICFDSHLWSYWSWMEEQFLIVRMSFLKVSPRRWTADSGTTRMSCSVTGDSDFWTCYLTDQCHNSRSQRINRWMFEWTTEHSWFYIVILSISCFA